MKQTTSMDRPLVVGKLVSFGVYCFPTTNFQRKPMNMPFPTSQPFGVLFFLFQEGKEGENTHLISSWAAGFKEVFFNLPHLRAGEGAKTSFFHLYDVFLSNPSFLFVDV